MKIVACLFRSVLWLLLPGYTSEVARAINSLMRFTREDQESMLEVIGDFFSYPTNSSVHDPEDDFSDDDDDDEMEMETGNKDINNL